MFSLNHLFKPDLNETTDFDSNSKKLDKNEELLRHALAVLISENKNLMKQLEKDQDSLKTSAKFTNALNNNDTIVKKIQMTISNQKALINKENEISGLKKLINELDESFNDLKSKYNELEIKVLKKGRIDEEIVCNDVRNVLDYMIEKVETKITQQDFDNTVNKLGQVQVF